MKSFNPNGCGDSEALPPRADRISTNDGKPIRIKTQDEIEQEMVEEEEFLSSLGRMGYLVPPKKKGVAIVSEIRTT